MNNNDDYAKAVEQQRQAEMMKQAALFNFMSKDARERFKRVEMVHPNVAQKALMMALQWVQAGRVNEVNDELLKNILSSVKENKEYNIINK
ncbi:MAG: DNA-binding protein [Candidatus Nanoarchaeia archaeon]|jgi:DNA-binding TFAR19-related protein (PDSD5 family)